MSFRLSLPLGTHYQTERPCADGQLGGILKLYRDWKLSGDLDWLRSIWPLAKRSLEYAWSPDNHDRWDPERSGVLWGRQHHTLDMELFGPNSWLTGFYLGALKAAAEMADALGEPDTATEYRAIHERGRAWVSLHLFNGEYFVQHLDLTDRSVLRPFAATEAQLGLLGDGVEHLYWSQEHRQLKYQLGDGVLIDQVLGQWHASLYGLGDVLDPAQVASAVAATYRYNFQERLGDVVNPCRVFGLDDESGTVIASWPDPARKPAVPVPYAQETMHGMEYAFGEMLMLTGRVAEGVRVFAAVRDRYDGATRNPWNEIECGSNYARSMSSWGAVPVLSGFTFDAGSGRLGFSPRVRAGGRFRSLWSGPNSWGTVEITDGAATLMVLGGTLSLSALGLPLRGGEAVLLRLDDRALEGTIMGDAIRFAEPLSLGTGSALVVHASSLTLEGLPEVDELMRPALDPGGPDAADAGRSFAGVGATP
jgi:hypothetical protein